MALLLAVPVAARAQESLKAAFQGAFLVGVAVNRAQFTGEDTRGDSLIETQFDSITPENALKWQSVHPRPGVYDFSGPDAYVAFGEKNKMVVIGHTLIWHKQTPTWVFEDNNGKPVTREELLRRMHDHIQTVVGRYKGRIRGWDVVNEAINDDGSMRPSRWMQIIGPDYVEKAFQFAHEADPNAELYYNDYSLEFPAKRKGALTLLRKLRAEGIPVTAVGLQNHDSLTSPTLEQEDATIADFERLGLKVNITELDVSVLPHIAEQANGNVEPIAEATPKQNPYAEGLPENVQRSLAKRYAALFAIFLKHRKAIDRVTFWGVTDADTWLNNWPARGRTDYPLLFDRGGKPKPAFQAVIDVATAAAK